MHKVLCYLAVLLLVSACSNRADESGVNSVGFAKQPDILLIVADDLGYSDIGAYGGEINTPNLDRLASSGLQLTHFYTAPTCGPTRGMLMTGVDSHQVGTGANAAALQRLTELQGRPGYEGFLNQRAVTLAEHLQYLGYQTHMVGKWDLGGNPGSLPAARGFDRSFALINSGASHFSDMRGNFPFEAEAVYYQGFERVEMLESDFYSTRAYTNRMRSYLESSPQDKPWFGYLAYTAPHWPLQVPADYNLPAGYEAGWQAVANERLQRLKRLQLIPEDTPPIELSADWNQLSADQREREVRSMQLYAAMIEIMDQQLGELLEFARAKSGQRGRELVVVFLSDNGPEANNIAGIGATGAWVEAEFDQSLEAMGNPGSYVWTGQQWGQVSATPFRLFKSFVAEGGIRVPAIISAPGATGVAGQMASVMDLLPTLVELAGGDAREQAAALNGLPIQGVSLAPLLDDPSQQLERPPLGWELYGNRAIRRGDMKARLIWPPAGTGEWQLFDLSKDPAELNDLAARQPEVMSDLIALWQTYAVDNGVYIFDHDNGYGRYQEYAK